MDELENKLNTTENNGFWDSKFMYNLQSWDIVKYVRLALNVNNHPDWGLLDAIEFFENPKGVRDIIYKKLLIKELFETVEYLKESVKSHGNWYHSSIDLLVNKMGVNIEIKGLENLEDIKDGESVLYLSIHHRDIVGAMSIAAIGSYFYNKIEENKYKGVDKNLVKIIVNSLFEGIKHIRPDIDVNLGDIAYFVKNTGHQMTKKDKEKFNQEVKEKVNKYLDGGGHLILFLNEINPYIKIFGKKPFEIGYSPVRKSPARFAEHSKKIVPIYADFPRSTLISYVRIGTKPIQQFLDIFRLKNIFNLKDKTCTIYIGEPIDHKNNREYMKHKDLIRKGEYIRNMCFELPNKPYEGTTNLLELLPK